jgi:hypothetical protein
VSPWERLSFSFEIAREMNFSARDDFRLRWPALCSEIA